MNFFNSFDIRIEQKFCTNSQESNGLVRNGCMWHLFGNESLGGKLEIYKFIFFKLL